MLLPVFRQTALHRWTRIWMYLDLWWRLDVHFQPPPWSTRVVDKAGHGIGQRKRISSFYRADRRFANLCGRASIRASKQRVLRTNAAKLGLRKTDALSGRRERLLVHIAPLDALQTNCAGESAIESAPSRAEHALGNAHAPHASQNILLAHTHGGPKTLLRVMPHLPKEAISLRRQASRLKLFPAMRPLEFVAIDI